MGIKQRYSSQPVEIKVAIIGGLVVLLGAIIGGFFTLAAAEVKGTTPLPTPPVTASAANTESPTSSPARSSAVTATAAAAPAPSSSSPAPTPTFSSSSPTPTPTPSGPKSLFGTYTFTRQVITCTYSSCTAAPFVLTLNCPAPASCAASWSPYGSHPATFDGTTIKVSFTALGGNCKGTALQTALTLDVTVLSWTAGQGGAVRTPTQMQGTITASAPASSLGCPAAGDVETITYG